MTKKISITISFCIIGVLFFISCGKKVEKEGNKQVKLQFAFYGDIRNQPLGEAVVKTFHERNPSILIKVIPVVGDHNSKVLTMIAGGEGSAPDIMVFLPPLMAELASKDALLNLNSYMTTDKEFQSFKNDIHPASLNAGKIRGNFYSIPFWTNSIVLFYNKTIFDKERIEYPDETWDLNKLLSVSKELTKDIDNDGRIDQYGFFDNVHALGTFGGIYPYIRRNGNDLFNEDMSRCLIDTPEVINAIRWCFDLITKHKVTPSPLSGDERLRDYEQGFMTGKVAMTVSGRWSMSFFYKIKDFKWSTVPFPRGKVEYRPCAAMLLGAYSKTRYPKECWEFLKFTMTEEAQKIVCNQKVDIPVLKSVANSSEFMSKFSRPYENRVFLECLEGAEEYPYHFVGENEWMNSANTKLQLVLLGEKNLEDVCKEIADEYITQYCKKNQ